MDYTSLRQEALRELERLSGGRWTDFNPHDPGITILEQLCYVLTDLGYRTAHDIPDLLAEGGHDPYRNLHLPAKILTCRPVTPADLRRVALDVRGVQNAWVEPLLGEDAPTLYFHAAEKALRLTKEPFPSEPVRLKGLYRVLVDPAEDAGVDLRARVARRLHENRALCEDFAEITVLDREMVQIDATVEIGPVDDIPGLQREIARKIAGVISPPVPFRTLDDMLREGLSLDAIFDGPQLERGFLPDEALEGATRRTAINASDLVRAIKDVAAVRAVSRVRIRLASDPEKKWRDWSVTIGAGMVAKLHREGSTITLRRAGTVVARATCELPAPAAKGAAAAASGLAPPPGRDRHVGKYTSVQQHFPAIYGIGELGLPASAPPERRARAKQLQAYLMFFDQIMANHLAQLAHARDLFSHEDTELKTYFAQPVPLPGEGGAILAPHDEETTLTRSLAARNTDGGASAVEVERKNRFLNHLLARFAETLDDHGTSSPTALAHRKQAFLRQYPRLGGARGTGFDHLEPPGPNNRASLEQRVRLRLGLTDEESPIVIEHILLRPMEGDEKQEVPLLATKDRKDPYSMQLTFVLPAGAGRFAEKKGSTGWKDFRALAEQTIREETPAHLTVYVRWMDAADWEAFPEAHGEWLRERRVWWAGKLGLTLKEER